MGTLKITDYPQLQALCWNIRHDLPLKRPTPWRFTSATGPWSIRPGSANMSEH